MHLFCLHHAGGTTASFAGWRFPGFEVTKLGYRGRDFRSIDEAADDLAERMEASSSPRLALYGHSMGAILAFEAALRLQGSGRVEHVFLAAARPPWNVPHGSVVVSREGVAARASVFSGELSERAREILVEDLALLATYPGRPPEGQLKVPTTILYGDDDPVVPAIDSVRWVSWCSSKPRLVEVSGGGHLFHRTSPDVLELVRTTLAPAKQMDPASPGAACASARLAR